MQLGFLVFVPSPLPVRASTIFSTISWIFKFFFVHFRLNNDSRKVSFYIIFRPFLCLFMLKVINVFVCIDMFI